jgi:hypothetical protein
VSWDEAGMRRDEVAMSSDDLTCCCRRTLASVNAADRIATSRITVPLTLCTSSRSRAAAGRKISIIISVTECFLQIKEAREAGRLRKCASMRVRHRSAHILICAKKKRGRTQKEEGAGACAPPQRAHTS